MSFKLHKGWEVGEEKVFILLYRNLIGEKSLKPRCANACGATHMGLLLQEFSIVHNIHYRGTIYRASFQISTTRLRERGWDLLLFHVWWIRPRLWLVELVLSLPARKSSGRKIFALFIFTGNSSSPALREAQDNHFYKTELGLCRSLPAKDQSWLSQKLTCVWPTETI